MSTTQPAPASRILIVEDSPANIQTLTATLKEKGYQISVATNGNQALDVVARVRPDLILLESVHGDKCKYSPIVTIAKEECIKPAKYNMQGEKGLVAWLQYFLRSAADKGMQS